MKIPKRAKLIADGGFYKFVPLKKLLAKINVPAMRRIKLNEAAIEYEETWYFTLVFSLSRVLKGYVEYKQTDAIKVEDASK